MWWIQADEGERFDRAAGPAWRGSGVGSRQRVLYWVDMLAGDLLSQRYVDGVVCRQHVGSVAAAVRPRLGGGLVIALEWGFAEFDPAISDLEVLDPIWDEPSVRMNDGGCDPQGRFLLRVDGLRRSARTGSALPVGLGASVRVVLEPVTISNRLPGARMARSRTTWTPRLSRLTRSISTPWRDGSATGGRSWRSPERMVLQTGSRSTPRARGVPEVGCHAAYSWISPPRTSRRRI